MSTGADARSLPAVVLDRLAAGAENADRSLDWPLASWDAIRSAGVPAWSVPTEYGGSGLNQAEMLRSGEAIASACLTTAFILAQQEAAVRLLLKGPEHLKDRYLRGVAAGELFLTVGLSHLTTSRQDRGPYLRANPVAGGFVLDGQIPWVTGADRADAIVIGATLPDATQVVLALPSGRAGVTVAPPLALASFNGSRTSFIRFEGVAVEPELILLGPGEQVLGKAAGGGLETSGLAVGLAAAATAYLRNEAAHRPALADRTARFEASLAAARRRLYALAADPVPEANPALRVDCSRLALRATQAALLVAKGTGFVATHPAQRWARQALFFLVWSCPPQVAEELLEELLPK
jgi:alkylation response protein AidB-like acyl-CoA dehydrogenase